MARAISRKDNSLRSITVVFSIVISERKWASEDLVNILEGYDLQYSSSAGSSTLLDISRASTGRLSGTGPRTDIYEKEGLSTCARIIRPSCDRIFSITSSMP